MLLPQHSTYYEGGNPQGKDHPLMSSSRLGMMARDAVEEPIARKHTPRNQQDRGFAPNRSHRLSQLRAPARGWFKEKPAAKSWWD
jgi:hypothetical protein